MGDNKRLRIDSAGFIYFENKISAKLSCNMHFERFPMDVQVCSIKIESLAYYKEDVVFAWFPRLASYLHDFDRYKVSSEDERLSPSIEFEDDIELSQYKLQGYMVKDCTSLKDKFPCIEGQFILSRQVGFYFFRYYIPTALIVMLSWIPFWISSHFGYEQTTMIRLSFGIVTLVVIAIQFVSLSTNSKTNITAIDIWMLFCMIFIVAALIANVLEKSKTDKTARWIFPISFTLLSLTYYAFYMSTRMSEGMDNMIIYES